MKNVFKVLGIIALVAVIGFGVVSCNNGGGGGSGGGAWADLVGEWRWTSGENYAQLIVNAVQNSTLGGTILRAHDVAGSQGMGSWIQCSVSGTTLKLDNGEKTFTYSLSADKNTLTLSNFKNTATSSDYSQYEGTYTRYE